MSIPDATFAEWLQAQCLYQTAADATIDANWSDDAVKSERITALANSTDAADEATRQRTFMGIPMAKENHVLSGRFSPLIGQVITVTIAQLGYDAGLDVLVLAAQDDLATNLSTVTVLRRLT